MIGKGSCFVFCFLVFSALISCNHAPKRGLADPSAMSRKDALLYDGDLDFDKYDMSASVYVSTNDGRVHLTWAEPEASNYYGIQVSYSYVRTDNNTSSQGVETNTYVKGSPTDVAIIDAKKMENLVLNVRIIDTSGKVYPPKTIVKVIELVTTNYALGRGYNVADSGFYKPLHVSKGAIIDMLKLKNWNRFSAGMVVMNESTQEYEYGTSLEEMSKKASRSVTTKFKAGVSSSFYKVFFKLDIEKTAKTSSSESESNKQKDFYGMIKAKVVRKKEWVLSQYATPDVLKDFLTPQFEKDINNPNVSPESIFEIYGTHVLLNTYVGARMDVNYSGTFKDNAEGATAEKASKELWVALSKQEYSSATSSSSCKESETRLLLEAVGGPPIETNVTYTSAGISSKFVSWAQEVDDSNSVFIDSPDCIENEDWSTGIWLYAEDPERQSEICNAYYKKLYGNYADVISMSNRKADDGLYVKSFGFIPILHKFYNQGYLGEYDAPACVGDCSVVASNSSYNRKRYLEELTIPEPSELKKLVKEIESEKGVEVIGDDVLFFVDKDSPDGIFKIIDTQLFVAPFRNDYENWIFQPYRRYDGTWHTFQFFVFVPYCVMTRNPNEALRSLISVKVDLNDGVMSSDKLDSRLTAAFAKHEGLRMLGDLKVSKPKTLSEARTVAAIESFRPVCKYVFNERRSRLDDKVDYCVQMYYPSLEKSNMVHWGYMNSDASYSGNGSGEVYDGDCSAKFHKAVSSSGTKISPSVVFSSDCVDEDGRIGISAADPIREIDFAYVKSDSGKIMESLSSTQGVPESSWEMLDEPVGAGSWVARDEWSNTEIADFGTETGCVTIVNRNSYPANFNSESLVGKQYCYLAKIGTLNYVHYWSANNSYGNYIYKFVPRLMDRYDIYIRYRR
ncbi:MAG TPA: hypothetical protein DCO86_00240 [Spirochaetaceae bacterium]|nr:hypothetical protein [Spirochaetaceae bacterium]